MTKRQRDLLLGIEHAFAGVELGNGVGLRESVVIDSYGGQCQREAARAADEKHNWRKLLKDPQLVRINGVGGLMFCDAAGLRFHLPAYLSLAVTDFGREDTAFVLDDLMFHLTNPYEYNRQRLAILTAVQRRCVRDVLVYLRDAHQLESAELDQAIEGYWGRPEPG